MFGRALVRLAVEQAREHAKYRPTKYEFEQTTTDVILHA